MKFIESLRLEEGGIRNLPLHQSRMDLTLLAHFGRAARIDLAAELTHRALPASGLYKVRVTYGRNIESIDIDPYTRPAVKAVKLVYADTIDYRYKYADRSALDALRRGLEPGVQPIIVRQGIVTDAVYANVCLYDGEDWVTPLRPLLSGVARAAALAQGQVTEEVVPASDVMAGRYTKVRLINCMTGFSEAAEISLESK